MYHFEGLSLATPKNRKIDGVNVVDTEPSKQPNEMRVMCVCGCIVPYAHMFNVGILNGITVHKILYCPNRRKRGFLMKNTQNTNTNTVLVDALVYNNRFASAKLTGEQIGVENFSNFKALVDKLHRASYSAYVVCENSGLQAESTSIDKTEIFNAIREILATIGEVNGHKLYANAEMAIAMIGYSGRRANKDAGELQLCLSRLSNARKELSKYKDINVSDEEHKAKVIAEMESTISALEDEKTELLKTADMRIKQPTRTNSNAFRLDVEHFLARVITGQLAKTLEELDAEEAARKAKRAEAAKARKAKKNA